MSRGCVVMTENERQKALAKVRSLLGEAQEVLDDFAELGGVIRFVFDTGEPEDFMEALGEGEVTLRLKRIEVED